VVECALVLVIRECPRAWTEIQQPASDEMTDVVQMVASANRPIDPSAERSLVRRRLHPIRKDKACEPTRHDNRDERTRDERWAPRSTCHASSISQTVGIAPLFAVGCRLDGPSLVTRGRSGVRRFEIFTETSSEDFEILQDELSVLM
jgi:hypothetical protein